MKQLLVEKYRPQNIEEYIFQNDSVKNNVIKWLEEGEIPNILLHSKSPGSGKSTLSRILVKELDIDPADVKYVNMSLVKGMDFVRDELEPWLKKKSFSAFKVVQFEEFYKLHSSAQKALRNITEDYSDRVRFIATCNYVSKLEPALVSRFQQLDLDTVSMDAILDAVSRIIEGEELDFNEEDDILSHIEAYAPDMRKIINSIDNHTSNGKIAPLTNAIGGNDTDAWEDAWKQGDVSLETLIPLTDGIDLNNFEQYYEAIYMNGSAVGDDQGKLVTLCSKYLDRAYRCANQRLHLDAFLYEFFLFSDEDE